MVGNSQIKKKVDIIKEEFEGVTGPLTQTQWNNKQTLVNKWVKDKETIKANYKSNPRACRVGGGGRHDKCPKFITQMAYKQIWEESFYRDVIINSRLMRSILLATIRANSDYRVFTNESGYQKKNKNHILIGPYFLRKFRHDWDLYRLISCKTTYNPGNIIEQQIPSLCKILIIRKLLPIKLGIVIYACIVYMLYICYLCMYCMCVVSLYIYRRLINHDQSMVYGYSWNGTNYIPWSLQKNKGHPKMQNDRKTFTMVPTFVYNYESKQFELGTTFAILESTSGLPVYPGPSTVLRNNLDKLGIKVGYNADGKFFVTSSMNGWNQWYNLPDQVEEIARSGEGSVIQLDNHVGFHNEELFVKPLLRKCVIPR